MENSGAKDSAGVCEKIYNAVVGQPAFRGNHRKSGRPVSSQKSGGMTINPSNIKSSAHSKRKDDAAKSSTVFVHIQGHEDEVKPKQQEMVKTTVASGNDQLKKVSSNNGSKPAFSSLKEGKERQERAVSPNIIVIQGRGQGINVSPEVETAKTVPHIPVQGVQTNPKPAILKIMSRKIDHLIHHGKSVHRESEKAEQGGKSDHRESKKAEQGVKSDHRESKRAEQPHASDKFSDYISHVKTKMRTLSNVGNQNEIARPAARLATRRDSFNDRVANYINRARNNFRTTSNVDHTS